MITHQTGLYLPSHLWTHATLLPYDPQVTCLLQNFRPLKRRKSLLCSVANFCLVLIGLHRFVPLRLPFCVQLLQEVCQSPTIVGKFIRRCKSSAPLVACGYSFYICIIHLSTTRNEKCLKCIEKEFASVRSFFLLVLLCKYCIEFADDM